MGAIGAGGVEDGDPHGKHGHGERDLVGEGGEAANPGQAGT